ncbi:HK97 family phage prohead protease [uncultured Chryseobacterium sp.]|uniref:HK97 family phage prohead protease n=1 Tax=uncultured Chryseobacterium sp. TaxID=259322 RepID=UPI002585FF6D|nr:HK97 family phage prohead protease [uncultured Chryseobacterium sp.]
MKGILELKNTGSVSDVDVKSRIVSGYLSSFDNIDSDNDIIVKGAFQKSINERFSSIFFLYQHDWSKPLGKFKTLQEDQKGLYFEAEIVETSYGVDQLKLYESGLVNEHSIGFQTIKSDTATSGTRTIKEVKLYEGSAVTLGANSQTPFTGFKSQTQQKDAISKIVTLMKNGNLTDDTFIQLELALKMLQSEAYELGKTENTQSKNEPSADTQMKAYEPLLNTLTSFKIN